MSFVVYTDLLYARCPCGWSWVGSDDGRNFKNRAMRLHARKCSDMEKCLRDPNTLLDVASFVGDGSVAGRLNTGQNYGGNGLSRGSDIWTKIDETINSGSAVRTPLADEVIPLCVREKKAKENRKKRLAKKRAKAKRKANSDKQ